jgi:hypothetical protein
MPFNTFEFLDRSGLSSNHRCGNARHRPQGLSAPTMGIAEEAGIANRSLFTYFETKSDLFNQLYLDLKEEMASVATKDLPTEAESREQYSTSGEIGEAESRCSSYRTREDGKFPRYRKTLKRYTISIHASLA